MGDRERKELKKAVFQMTGVNMRDRMRIIGVWQGGSVSLEDLMVICIMSVNLLLYGTIC